MFQIDVGMPNIFQHLFTKVCGLVKRLTEKFILVYVIKHS